MDQKTLKQTIFCDCSPKDREHHPLCCFRCRFCYKKIKAAFIQDHEVKCELSLLIRLGDVKSESDT